MSWLWNLSWYSYKVSTLQTWIIFEIVYRHGSLSTTHLDVVTRTGGVALVIGQGGGVEIRNAVTIFSLGKVKNFTSDWHISKGCFVFLFLTKRLLYILTSIEVGSNQTLVKIHNRQKIFWKLLYNLQSEKVKQNRLDQVSIPK